MTRLYGENPDQTLKDDLRRFKQILETGDVVRSEASPQGTNVGRVHQGPTQPADARRAHTSLATGG